MTTRMLYGLWIGAVIIACLGRAAAAQSPALRLSETFDAAVPPGLPPGWNGDAQRAWETSGSVASGGSGANNLTNAGNRAGWVTSPALDLSNLAAATLRYVARRTGTYARDNLAVTASLDGGATFPVLVLAPGAALPEATSRYEAVAVELPRALVGRSHVVLRFEAGGSSGGNVRLDDVQVEGAASAVAAVPDRLVLTAAGGGRAEGTVTLTNHGGQPVQVEAPSLPGPVFSVAPDAPVVLAPGASADYVVAFTPPGEAAFEGRLVFRHELGETVVALSGRAVDRRFGFASSGGTAPRGDGLVELPLYLALSGTAGLQGLQFEVTWDAPGVRLVDVVRGAAVADTAAWMLSYEAGGAGLQGVLLGVGSEGLAPGAYRPLLVLRLSTAGVEAEQVRFHLAGVFGALAVPTGEDAGLLPEPDGYLLSLREPVAYGVPSVQALDLGVVAVGASAVAQVRITNAGGTRDLAITEVASSNPRFTVQPAAAVVPPEESRTFEVAFTPSDAGFGLQEGTLSFVHDGADGPVLEVGLTAQGTGGRGDTDANGLVDVVDLIHLVDFVLKRRAPGEPQRRSADVFPFPAGDGLLDVRDLTVLAQAIARGAWPDGSTLPMERPSSTERQAAAALRGGQGAAGGTAGVSVHLVPQDGGTALYLEHDVPLRALQLVLRVGDPPGAAALVRSLFSGAEALFHLDPPSQVLRVLLFRGDGGAVAPGRRALGWLARALPEGALEVRYAAAVDENLARLPVNVSVGAAAGEGPAPAQLELGRPYPHPFRPGQEGTLYVPLALPAPALVRLAVYDVLGRRVATLVDGPREAGHALFTWDGRDGAGLPVPSGLYVLRVEAGGYRQARSLVVLR